MGRLVALPGVLLLLLGYVQLQNVVVTQSPAAVNTGSASVNLTCNATKGQGSVWWMWEKEDFTTYNISFSDGNTTLQINQPNKTHNGKYICFWKNTSLAWGDYALYVYYKVENVVVSTSSGNVVEGSTPSLNLTCNSSTLWEGTITWLWEGKTLDILDNSSRLLDGNQTLQINQPNKTHNGNYTCVITNPASNGTGTYRLYVYYKVENVVVSTSSGNVVEGSTPSLNLTCNSSAPWEGTMTWLWEGNPVNTVNTSYSLLDGNATLQINQPSRSNNGNYTCVIANPASRGEGYYTLTVLRLLPTAFSPGTLAGIIIGSVLGGLLLIALIVLIVCCAWRKGKKEKWPKYKDAPPTVSGQITHNGWNTPTGAYARWERTTQSSHGMGHKTSIQNSTSVIPQKQKSQTAV
ncbi:hemicentin-1-like [Xenopus tropicalis]|uniref:Hemicentin-1-like n=1 Tax=Xenopus tropicalis TaxID=8364 RepID=A0A8J1JYX5_XENTR|nr:hemicentin-1-like [Xenopus tropicalis]